MHILLICHEFPPTGGGAATASLRMAEAFVRKGARVTVLTAAFADLPLHEERNGYTVIRLRPARRQSGTSNILEFTAFILSAAGWVLRKGRSSKCTITLAMMGIPAGPAAWVLRKTAGTPYIVSLRGGDVPGHLSGMLAGIHRFTAPFIRRIWRDAAAVVANSDGLAELAKAHAPWLEVSVIRNGVDSRLFTPRSAISFSSPPQLLYTGRLNEGKNIDVLLSSLAELRQLPWHLHLAGDGPLRPALEASLPRLGLVDRVSFHGWLSRTAVPEMYRQADIFVFPSSGEGTSNSLLEAMACGLPIVTHAVRGCIELVEDGVNGYAVPENNPAALTTALRTLIENRKLRAAMGEASRVRIDSLFSWADCAEAFLRIFHRVCPTRDG